MLGMPAVPAPPPQEPPPPPRASSRLESPRSSSNTQASAAEMNWEAPPGEMQQQKPRTGMRAALKPPPRTESGTLPMGDLSEEQEWEAPEATEVPQRRRTGTEAPRRNLGNTSVARAPSPSRVDVGRSTGTEAPAARRTGTRNGVTPEAEVPAPRPSRAAMALNPRNRPPEDDDEDPERTMLPPPPEPELPRRRTGMAPSAPSASVRRGTSSRADMPQAPTRRTSFVEKVQQEEDDDEELSARTDAPRSKPAAPAPSRPWVKSLLGAVGVLAVLGAAVLFRQPLLDTLNSTAIDGQDIFITLESNEPVQVSVKHNERCRSAVPITELATEPITSLKQASGAHIQDTIILENKHRGILKEVPLDYGEPNETKTIREEFKMGFFRLALQPNKKIPGLEIYREGQKLYLFQSGQRYELAEGTHHLELRAPSLRDAVPVEIEVKADGRTAEKTVDLAQALP